MSETQTTLERLTEILGGARNSRIAMVAAEIDGLTAQLAEARAQFVLLDDEQASSNVKADRVIAELETQLAEARAEVERLRPAAEAFGWWENYTSNPSTTTWDIFQTAAQRARDLSFVESRAVILDDHQIDALKRGMSRAREARK